MFLLCSIEKHPANQRGVIFIFGEFSSYIRKILQRNSLFWLQVDKDDFGYFFTHTLLIQFVIEKCFAAWEFLNNFEVSGDEIYWLFYWF